MRADEKDQRDESLMREQEMKKNKRGFRAFERARQVWNKRMKRKDGATVTFVVF